MNLLFKISQQCSHIEIGRETHKHIRLQLRMGETLKRLIFCRVSIWKGHNVLIKQSYGPAKVTKYGVTVAKNIDFKHEVKEVLFLNLNSENGIKALFSKVL
ncbi:unnamed protein product [Lactuca virosa]|uniref:Uncharacterized protein n=1 Tax=Lactuca virosa TaxID=75947 RepID=A0AAU9N569_9ASTR|nr:unnamed protein product [Lactuca virosa]